MIQNFFRLAFTLLAMTASTLSFAQSPAGTVVLSSGFVQATTGESVRSLKRGDLVLNGDEISTGSNSYANIRFSDDGRTLMRPNTRLAVEGYSWPASIPPADRSPATVVKANALTLEEQEKLLASEGRSVFRLVRGALRTLTGLIGKANTDNYKMLTPVVTIGIRGTDFGVYHDETSNTTSVTVFEGGVSLTPIAAGAATKDLSKGQSAKVDANGTISELTDVPQELEVTATDDPKNCE